jgi:hypothetical protein
MGTSTSFTFRILKILKSYISMSSKIMALGKKKVPLKNTLYFRKYEKDKFLIINSSKVVVK